MRIIFCRKEKKIVQSFLNVKIYAIFVQIKAIFEKEIRFFVERIKGKSHAKKCFKRNHSRAR